MVFKFKEIKTNFFSFKSSWVLEGSGSELAKTLVRGFELNLFGFAKKYLKVGNPCYDVAVLFLNEKYSLTFIELDSDAASVLAYIFK